MPGVVLAQIVSWVVVGGWVGYVIDAGKGRPTEGLWLGALLGWIGWIVVALMEMNTAHHHRPSPTLG
jgi:hypothetical protein